MEDVFQGCTFYVDLAGLQREEVQNPLLSVLVKSGGQVTHVLEESTHAVLWHEQQHMYTAAVAAGKAAVSPVWVWACVEAQRLLPRTHKLYQPFPAPGLPGAEAFIGAISGFTGVAKRCGALTLLACCGMAVSKTLTPQKNTHLVAQDVYEKSAKLEAARSFGIHILNLQWPIDCLTQWLLLPDEHYREQAERASIVMPEVAATAPEEIPDSSENDSQGGAPAAAVRSGAAAPSGLGPAGMAAPAAAAAAGAAGGAGAVAAHQLPSAQGQAGPAATPGAALGLVIPSSTATGGGVRPSPSTSGMPLRAQASLRVVGSGAPLGLGNGRALGHLPSSCQPAQELSAVQQQVSQRHLDSPAALGGSGPLAQGATPTPHYSAEQGGNEGFSSLSGGAGGGAPEHAALVPTAPSEGQSAPSAEGASSRRLGAPSMAPSGLSGRSVPFSEMYNGGVSQIMHGVGDFLETMGVSTEAGDAPLGLKAVVEQLAAGGKQAGEAEVDDDVTPDCSPPRQTSAVCADEEQQPPAQQRWAMGPWAEQQKENAQSPFRPPEGGAKELLQEQQGAQQQQVGAQQQQRRQEQQQKGSVPGAEGLEAEAQQIPATLEPGAGAVPAGRSAEDPGAQPALGGKHSPTGEASALDGPTPLAALAQNRALLRVRGVATRSRSATPDGSGSESARHRRKGKAERAPFSQHLPEGNAKELASIAAAALREEKTAAKAERGRGQGQGRGVGRGRGRGKGRGQVAAAAVEGEQAEQHVAEQAAPSEAGLTAEGRVAAEGPLAEGVPTAERVAPPELLVDSWATAAGMPAGSNEGGGNPGELSALRQPLGQSEQQQLSGIAEAAEQGAGEEAAAQGAGQEGAALEHGAGKGLSPVMHLPLATGDKAMAEHGVFPVPSLADAAAEQPFNEFPALDNAPTDSGDDNAALLVFMSANEDELPLEEEVALDVKENQLGTALGEGAGGPDAEGKGQEQQQQQQERESERGHEAAQRSRRVRGPSKAAAVAAAAATEGEREEEVAASEEPAPVAASKQKGKGSKAVGAAQPTDRGRGRPRKGAAPVEAAAPEAALEDGAGGQPKSGCTAKRQRGAQGKPSAATAAAEAAVDVAAEEVAAVAEGHTASEADYALRLRRKSEMHEWGRVGIRGAPPHAIAETEAIAAAARQAAEAGPSRTKRSGPAKACKAASANGGSKASGKRRREPEPQPEDEVCEEEEEQQQQLVKGAKRQRGASGAARPSQPGGTPGRAGEPCFALSGFKSTEQKQLSAVLRKLKVKCIVGTTSHNWTPAVTHVVAPEMRRYQKCLAGLAAGNWLLGRDYVAACKEAGQLVQPDDYELSASTGKVDAGVASHWRRRKETLGEGAFEGLRVGVYTELDEPGPSHEDISIIIRAGGGYVVPLAMGRKPGKAAAGGLDLVVAPSDGSEDDKGLAELLEGGALCVSSEYVVGWLARPRAELGGSVLLGSKGAAEGGAALAAERRRGSVEGEELEPLDSLPPCSPIL